MNHNIFRKHQNWFESTFQSCARQLWKHNIDRITGTALSRNLTTEHFGLVDKDSNQNVANHDKTSSHKKTAFKKIIKNIAPGITLFLADVEKISGLSVVAFEIDLDFHETVDDISMNPDCLDPHRILFSFTTQRNNLSHSIAFAPFRPSNLEKFFSHISTLSRHTFEDECNHPSNM